MFDCHSGESLALTEKEIVIDSIVQKKYKNQCYHCRNNVYGMDLVLISTRVNLFELPLYNLGHNQQALHCTQCNYTIPYIDLLTTEPTPSVTHTNTVPATTETAATPTVCDISSVSRGGDGGVAVDEVLDVHFLSVEPNHSDPSQIIGQNTSTSLQRDPIAVISDHSEDGSIVERSSNDDNNNNRNSYPGISGRELFTNPNTLQGNVNHSRSNDMTNTSNIPPTIQKSINNKQHAIIQLHDNGTVVEVCAAAATTATQQNPNLEHDAPVVVVPGKVIYIVQEEDDSHGNTFRDATQIPYHQPIVYCIEEEQEATAEGDHYRRGFDMDHHNNRITNSTYIVPAVTEDALNATTSSRHDMFDCYTQEIIVITDEDERSIMMMDSSTPSVSPKHSLLPQFQTNLAPKSSQLEKNEGLPGRQQVLNESSKNSSGSTEEKVVIVLDDVPSSMEHDQYAYNENHHHHNNKGDHYSYSTMTDRAHYPCDSVVHDDTRNIQIPSQSRSGALPTHSELNDYTHYYYDAANDLTRINQSDSQPSSHPNENHNYGDDDSSGKQSSHFLSSMWTKMNHSTSSVSPVPSNLSPPTKSRKLMTPTSTTTASPVLIKDVEQFGLTSWNLFAI